MLQAQLRNFSFFFCRILHSDGHTALSRLYKVLLYAKNPQNIPKIVLFQKSFLHVFETAIHHLKYDQVKLMYCSVFTPLLCCTNVPIDCSPLKFSCVIVPNRRMRSFSFTPFRKGKNTIKLKQSYR